MATRITTELPHLIANRYQVQRILGQGGMAEVYQVLDTISQTQVALKQLLGREDETKYKEITGLFENEYYTLAQLAHPQVIQVFDYGLSEIGPYYTMELLDGGDLRELSPVPWKKACALLGDICSALAMLHSRRFIHRDLSTRNIRCTRDEKAKLIDFGAMIPMGPSKMIVGTPQFTAPEVVNYQNLDARTDLYSLGTAAYYALAGHHAYPAKTFNRLRDIWRSQPWPLSNMVADIPKELENLIMSMINLNPMARPGSAAEVMERLCAIAGLQMDEQLVVSQTYLSTPMLQGRTHDLLRVRKLIIRALRRRGGKITIKGASGVGRSRFLNACVLEAKLAEVTVLKADAADASQADWSIVRALIMRLMQEHSEKVLETIQPYISVLGHILPELDQANLKADVPKKSSTQQAESDDSERGASRQAHQQEDSASSASAEVWGQGHSWRPPKTSAKSNRTLNECTDPQQLRSQIRRTSPHSEQSHSTF